MRYDSFVLFYSIFSHSLIQDPESHISTTPLLIAIINGHHNIVELLLSRGGNILDTDGNGNGSFHYACWSDLDTVKVLVEHVSLRARGELLTLMTRNKEGELPFDIAVAREHFEIVKYLLSREDLCPPQK